MLEDRKKVHEILKERFGFCETHQIKYPLDEGCPSCKQLHSS